MDEVGAVTTARLLEMAEQARAKAMAEKGGASAAIQALTAIAKLTGKWIERSERTNIKGDLNDLSDSDLAQIVRQGLPQPTVNPEAKKLN